MALRFIWNWFIHNNIWAVFLFILMFKLMGLIVV